MFNGVVIDELVKDVMYFILLFSICDLIVVCNVSLVFVWFELVFIGFVVWLESIGKEVLFLFFMLKVYVYVLLDVFVLF